MSASIEPTAHGLRAGAIFLVRRTPRPTGPTTWATSAEARPDLFTTIEGNATTTATREGHGNLQLSRGYKNKNFIRL